MQKWRKTLAQMVQDSNPVSYRYDEAASILSALGFAEPPRKAGTSHRPWRYRNKGVLVVIGLKEAGRGTMKPCYVRDMVRTLCENGLLPADLR